MLQVLHLSDIHFGKLLPKQIREGKSASAHRFVKSSSDEPNPNVLADILKRDFESQPPPIMILSGDVGWSGAEKDYEYALEFLENLRKEWKNTRIIIAPGNHDVVLSSAGNRHGNFVQFLQKFYGDAFDNYYPLLKRTSPDEDTYSSSIVAFHNITVSNAIFKGEVLVVAVNSAAYLQSNGIPVYISPDVLPKVEAEIRRLKLPADTLRLFVVHHHLLPFAEPEWRNVSDPSDVPDKPDPTIIANSAKLQAWLAEQSFHIVMHGHKHLSHGRDDILHRHNDPISGRHLFIIGAGSAGVEQFHRSFNEPLSYNLLSISKLSRQRWHVDVSVKQIHENEIAPNVSEFYKYSSTVGVEPGESPFMFRTEYMDDCHRIIKERAEGEGLLRNFISIVENSDYRHPITARIGQRAITQKEIESSFHTLHPEYIPSKKWTDFSGLDPSLRSMSRLFQFQHGPRLFGIPDEGRYIETDNMDQLRPIMKAVGRLKQAQKSHSYVSLFRTRIDVLGKREEPLPGLMSIQFIPDDTNRYLDVVVTFRKVELSFWWVVNMYEVISLLNWAASYERTTQRQPRRITFFSALAEWKENPEPTFLTQIDQLTIEQMADLLLNIETSNDATYFSTLTSLLIEKKEHTHENSLDPKGLEILTQLLAALQKRHKRSKKSIFSKELLKKITDAKDCIVKAMASRSQERYHSAQNAKKLLGEAVALLERRMP